MNGPVGYCSRVCVKARWGGSALRFVDLPVKFGILLELSVWISFCRLLASRCVEPMSRPIVELSANFFGSANIAANAYDKFDRAVVGKGLEIVIARPEQDVYLDGATSKQMRVG